MIAGAPTKGRLLVATPPLDDPNFDRTVVYMLEHHDEGALGVVINRPSEEELGEPLDRWSDLQPAPGSVFVGERRVCSGSERRVCARRRTARSYVRRTPRALSGPVAFAQSVRSSTFAEGQRQALGRPAPRSAACSAVAAPAVWPAATMPSHIDAAVFR